MENWFDDIIPDAKPKEDWFDDILPDKPAQATQPVKPSIPVAGIARKALDLAVNPVKPMLSQKGQGVGQGAIQALTGGYGMPALRKTIPDSEQVPLPSTKENIVGNAIALPVAGAGIGTVASKAGKLAPVVSAAVGYAMNPSQTDFTPIGDSKRVMGAAAGVVGQAVGSIAQKVAGYINPDAIQAFMRSVKPGKWNKTIKDDASVALPLIKKTGETVNSMEDFAYKATGAAKKSLWAQIQDSLDKAQGGMKYITRKVGIGVKENIPKNEFIMDGSIPEKPSIEPIFKDETILTNGVSGNGISATMNSSVNPDSIALTPKIQSTISRSAAKYEGKSFTVNELEDRLQRVNADLTSYFKASHRTGYVKGQQEDIAALLSERIAVKNALYNKVESLSGENIAPLKKQYGALMNVQDEALGRVNVAGRKNPVSLQEAINGVTGITELFGGNPLGIVRIGASEITKKVNDSDFLIKKAVENVGKVPSKLNRIIPASINAATNAVQTQYKIGQQIQTSKGNVQVVGFDTDGHPLIEPVK